MNIMHHSILDIANVEKLYSEKDQVPVKYVCTSAPNAHASYAADIFYRETPHPEFGNRYFGLYYNMNDTRLTKHPQVMITNCDGIETLEFNMVKGPDGWEYSQHRHDFRSVGAVAIDGGRSYGRRVGDLSVPVKTMKVLNGQFVEVSWDE